MRILALFCGAFSAGIFLAQYLVPERFLLSCALCGFLLACARFALPGNVGKRVLLVGVGLSLAFGYDWLYLRQTVDSMSGLYGTQQDISMTLCDYAEPASWGARASVKVDGLPGRVVYYGKRDLSELRPGATLRDTVRLEDARRVRESDVTAFTSRGVFTLAYGRGIAVAEDGPGVRDARWLPVRTGQAMREQIQSLFPGDAAPFLSALLTGDRTGLSVSSDVDISETGLSHVLAVSGMHCGFLIALTGFLLRRRSRVTAALVQILTLVFFALLAGAKPSVVRACIMLSMLLVAPLVRRDNDAPTALCVALFLILLQNPFAAASVSLQLSFACVAGLLSLSPKLYAFLRGGASSAVRKFAAASLAASLGVLASAAPLCAVYFGALALVMPLSNLLCLWAVGGAFASGLLVAALSFVCAPLAAVAAWVPILLIRYVLLCAHLLAKIPFHAVYFANPFLKYWLIYVYLLFVCAWLLRRPGVRLYALSAVLSCATLVVTLHAGQALYRNDMDALALDVGQGQSIALASRGRFALVDCGSSNSWKDAGTVAGQTLLSMGCRRLDALILTHFDSDHINGVETLLARLGVKALYVPDASNDDIMTLAERYKVPVRVVGERTAMGFGVGQLVLFPPAGSSGSNELGLSILASVGDNDFLITGDMNQETERLLLNRYAIPDLEAYVAGHHGSKYATSDELLSELTPEVVCVSVGSNSYGHPAPETLQRLSEHHCAVYRTDVDGTIHLRMNRAAPP